MKSLSPHSLECEARVLDKTGTEIEIRPLRPGDESLLRNFYLGLSEETVYSYYNYHMNRSVLVKEEKIGQECSYDHDVHMRLAAICKGEIIGVGMLLGSFCPEEVSEIGHLISDDYQGRGIATILMKILLSHAEHHQKGNWIFAQTSTRNAGSRKLLQKFGFTIKSMEDGEISWLYKIR